MIKTISLRILSTDLGMLTCSQNHLKLKILTITTNLIQLISLVFRSLTKRIEEHPFE